LTAAAAGRADVRLRFTLASSADVELMGWQVDDLIVRDPLLPPWQACGPALQYVSHRIDDAVGNGNGLADPGETVRLPVRLGNDGVAAASGVSATLRSGRPDLADFVSPTASYADLPPGGSAESDPPHPGLALSPAARCGTRIPVTLAARSAGGAATAGFDVVVGPGATTTSSFSPPPPLPLPIPDLDPTGVAVAIPVTAGEPALAIEVTVGITHPSAGQLVVTLTSPSGRTVTLHDFTGAGVAYGTRAYPAPVAPDGPGSLTDELGEVPAGTWTLRAIDAVGGTTGTLDAVTLRILHPDPAGGVSGPVASPLRLVREGSDVVATFGPAPGAAAHELAKAPSATLEGLAGVATTNTASARETGGAAAGGSYYYVVRGLDGCGRPGP
jgi:subtilisin-like proprotein convertase family protein